MKKSKIDLSSLEGFVEAAAVNVRYLGAHGTQISGKLPPMMHRMVLRKLQEQEHRHLHDAKKIHRLQQLRRRKGVDAGRGFGTLRLMPRYQPRDVFCRRWCFAGKYKAAVGDGVQEPDVAGSQMRAQ